MPNNKGTEPRKSAILLGGGYEYKVLKLPIQECEKTLNQYAREGWRVIEITPDLARSPGSGFVAFLERKAI